MANKNRTRKVQSPLALQEMAGLTREQIRAHICEAFGVTKEALAPFEVLVAIECDHGYESDNWFLLQKGSRLFENHGSHCSCYGYEDQWKPEPTTRKYLKSKNFSCSGECDEIRNWLKENL